MIAEETDMHTRSLINSNMLVPTPSVYIPAWMAETYTAYRRFSKRVERLWLPESSVQNKLPYYECAPPWSVRAPCMRVRSPDYFLKTRQTADVCLSH